MQCSSMKRPLCSIESNSKQKTKTKPTIEHTYKGPEEGPKDNSNEPPEVFKDEFMSIL